MDPIEPEECRVLRIKPGDIVVFETEDALSYPDSQAIRLRLQELLAEAGHAGVPTMVVTGGHLVKAQVVSRATPAAA